MGALNNTVDTNFRAINDNWSCFALERVSGNITMPAGPVVFAVGMSTDPAISFSAGRTAQSRSLFYRTKYSTDTDVISFFLNDYDSVVSFENNFDSVATTQISTTYADLAVLAARQVAFHIEITVSIDSDGN
ncbi:hypothetical protein FRC20_011936 [Serendipita sp. 405]|nr:hypothetical protein FRC20_011936 [Serendipita sp. 405]